MAGNGSQVLVVGHRGGELVMWLIDPVGHTSARVGTLQIACSGLTAEWFDGRWVVGTTVAADESYTDDWGSDTSIRGSLWSSTDAVSWTEADYPLTYMDELLPRGSRLFVLIGSLGGDHLWATSDLIDWELKRYIDDESDFFVPHYSEALGYFGFADMDPHGPGETWLMVSDDGTNWTPVSPSRGSDLLAVSHDRVLLGSFPGYTHLWLLTNEEPSAADTTMSSVATTTNPPTTLWLDEATHNAIYSEVGPVWADAFIAGNPAALADLYRSDAVHVDGISGDEARGRDQIETAFERHFDQIRYDTLTLNGWATGPAHQTDGGRLLTVRLYWDWEATPGDTALYGIPAESRILIDIDSRLIVWSAHPDREGG
jgi:hypothetical protein